MSIVLPPEQLARLRHWVANKIGDVFHDCVFALGEGSRAWSAIEGEPFAYSLSKNSL